VTIHPYANSQIFQPASAGGPIFGGKFDAAIFSNGPGPVYANIDGLYDCKSIPPNGFNVDRYCNPAVDALNERYVRSFDPAVRKQTAAAFQRIIDSDAPVAVVYLRAELSAYTSRLQGFHPSSFSDWGDPLQLDI
jgi:ABC-type transport system substrate-binding protein